MRNHLGKRRLPWHPGSFAFTDDSHHSSRGFSPIVGGSWAGKEGRRGCFCGVMRAESMGYHEGLGS